MRQRTCRQAPFAKRSVSGNRFLRSASLPAVLLLLLQAGCGDDDAGGNNNANANDNGNTNAAVCGDGLLGGVEECDEGAANSDTAPDACRTDCQPARCGDGVIDAEEACDDGAFNAEVPNACRPDCALPACGDGLVDTEQGETCDDGNLEAGDGCSPDCGVEYCGNGVVDADLGEVCDDGNFVAGDGCSPDCRVPCGNGVVDHAAERCDGAPPAGESCVTYGFDRGTLGCSSLCMPDFTGCGLLGWRVAPSAYTEELDRVWSHPSGFAVAVGYHGAIHQFDGAAWGGVASPVTARLYGVWGSAPDDVWAVGEGGTIVRYDGAAWSVVTNPPTTARITAISGRGPNDVWLAAFGGEFLHFNGSTWTAHSTTANTMNGLAVLGPDDVWAVGVGNLAWHWDGTEWASVSLPKYATYNGLFASGPTDVWAVGTSSAVAHFDGSVWREVQSPWNTVFYGVSGSGPDDVWILGGDFTPLMLHYDGRQLVPHPMPLGVSSLRDVHTSGRGGAWAVGLSGRAVRFHGSGWTEQPAPGSVLAFTVLPEGDVFAKIGDPTAPNLHHLDGGFWNDLGPVSQYGSLWASSPEDVWTVGDGTLDRWGGDAWTYLPRPVSPGVAHLAGTGPGDLWAAGLGTEMLHWDGVSLASVAVDASAHAVTALFVDPLGAVVAAGFELGPLPYPRKLIRFDGSEWHVELAPLSRAVNGIWGADPDDLWAVGEAGALLRYDGATWSVQPSLVSTDLRVVHGTGPADVWVGDVSGQLMRFDGVGWGAVSTPLVETLSELRATPRQIWAREIGGRLFRLLRNAPWECAAAERCDDGVDNDCDGLVDGHDPACAGCADGTAEQTFALGMVGCAGQVSFAGRASLCAAGYRPCRAAEWVRRHGRAGPSHHYWTDDDLLWTGPEESCWVSSSQGSALCSPDRPMRVCVGSVDPLGNTCTWTGCGLDAPSDLDYFGGCSADPTAGTLCCPE